MPVGGIGFGAMIEHPRALPHIDDIAEHGPRVIAMMLGGEDFALETGSVPGDETLELPKRLVAFAAQAHGVGMIGILGTVADYSDPRSLQEERRAGAPVRLLRRHLHPSRAGAGAERGVHAQGRGSRLRARS